MVDPNLANPLALNALPTVQKSKIDSDEPIFPKPYTDSVLPPRQHERKL
jgi:hypothetical protein